MEPFKINRNYGERVEAELQRNQISLTCASDWAGDTETGFGEYVTQHLDLNETKALRDWLSAAIEQMEN